MTPRKASAIVASGQPATVHNADYGETFTAIFVRKTRWDIISKSGGVYDRASLEVVEWPSTLEPNEVNIFVWAKRRLAQRQPPTERQGQK